MENTSARSNAKKSYATRGCACYAVATAPHATEVHIVNNMAYLQVTSANDQAVMVHKAATDR